MEVLLLTSADCPFCDDAKELLKRLSGEYELTVEERDIDSPGGRALAERGGIMFPPGVFIDGEAVLYGRPSERRLRRELERRPGPRGRSGLGGAATGALSLLAAAVLAGCGGDGGSTDEGPARADSPFERRLKEAQRASPSDFPAAGARTLQQVAAETDGQTQIGLATSVFTPGRNRLAFGMIDNSNRFIYGPSAIYLARSPGDRALGPFPAPADSLIVQRRFRSRQSASTRDVIAAIYSTRVPLVRSGRYSVLAVTRLGSRLVGATTEIAVKRSDPVPAPGERPPAIETPTVKSVGGDIEKIETRIPPDDMHRVSFRDVLGKRPVALVFATPALCESRTCGPAVDIAQQLKATYGGRMEFIHQEVFVDNDPSKGYRPQLRAFHLPTEPWFFTFDRRGRVAARLEGSIGLNAARRAVEAALRPQKG